MSKLTRFVIASALISVVLLAMGHVLFTLGALAALIFLVSLFIKMFSKEVDMKS